MRNVLFLLTLAACGTSPDHSAHPRQMGAETHNPTTPESNNGTEPLDRAAAQVVTIAEEAKALGVHWQFLILANQACAKNIECRHGRGQSVKPVDVCQTGLVRAWCPPNECTEPLFDGPDADNPCWADVRNRQSCDQMNEPIKCESLEKAGLVLRPDDWPLKPKSKGAH